jgi:hypothetical protein
MFPYINKVKKIVSLQFNEKKRGGGKLVLPPSTFQSGEGDCPHLLCPWSGISEVQLQTRRVLYYFINNIWYKYTGITKQKDKYLMADKKLRIHWKLKIEQQKHH